MDFAYVLASTPPPPPLYARVRFSVDPPNNNLKYLINVDRNTRRSNVVVFGVPEDEPLELKGVHAETDLKKWRKQDYRML